MSLTTQTTQPVQPPLTLWDHVWRLLILVPASLVFFGVQLVELGETLPDGSIVTDDRTDLLLLADLALGLLTYPLIFWRRRFPFTIAMVLTLVATFSSVAGPPAVLALVSLSARRRWQEIAPVVLVSVVSVMLFELSWNPEPLAWPWLILFSLAVNAVMVAVGVAIGSRRELIASLRQRAEATDAARAAHEEQARAQERNRIAREMHDVLAHRMSVVAMYAGAMAARDDLTDAERQSSAKVIEENARTALTDLRSVLGVLRDPDSSTAAVEPPQPTLTGLPTLLDEARAVGEDVRLEVEGVAGPDVAPWLAGVPEGVSRAAYRTVQEGLTNARKHAPGAPVVLRLSGRSGEDLVVDLRNGAAPGGAGLPGSGLGLVGLRERAELLGGTLEHRPLPDGGFVLVARLPWRA